MSPVFARSKITKLFLGALIVGAFASGLVVVNSWTRNGSLALDSMTRAALAADSYVILVRHGNAPGRSEPAGFDIHDCGTQRNLSEQGRRESRDLGQLFRARGFNVTKVLASRWCRAHETAELLNLGPVENSPVFDNLEFNKQRAAELLKAERNLIASWRGPGVLLIVTHSSNIKSLTGLEIEQGAMIVASSDSKDSRAVRFSKILLRNFLS